MCNMKIPTPAEFIALQDISNESEVNAIQDKILFDMQINMKGNTYTGTIKGPVSDHIMNRVKYKFERAGWKFKYELISDLRFSQDYFYTISHNLSNN